MVKHKSDPQNNSNLKEEENKTILRKFRFVALENISSQNPSPCNSGPVSHHLGIGSMFKVKYKNGTKKSVIFRFLLSKLLHTSSYETRETFSLEDYLILCDLYYTFRMEDKNLTFLEKFGVQLSELQPIFERLAENSDFPIQIVGSDSSEIFKILKEISPLLVMNENAYFGLKPKEFKNSYRLVFDNRLFNKKNHPPERYIGVGYKDKGNARNNANDGNQNWQEIGAVAASIEEDYPYDPEISLTYQYLVEDPRKRYPKTSRLNGELG